DTFHCPLRRCKRDVAERVSESARKNEDKQATIACLDKQVQALTAGLQRMRAQLELNTSGPQTVLKAVVTPFPRSDFAVRRCCAVFTAQQRSKNSEMAVWYAVVTVYSPPLLGQAFAILTARSPSQSAQPDLLLLPR